MDEMAIVIMEKDPETGFLSKELGSYKINYNIDVIEKAFAAEESAGKIVNLYLTLPGDFKDWEFNAILDNYDTDLYKDIVLSVEENEESYNPGWIFKFIFQDADNVIEKKLNDILSIHNKEINRVLEIIPSLENEYIH